MSGQPPTRSIAIPIVVLLLGAGYVLSYAPVYRMKTESGMLGGIAGYQPVEWLMDETPLRDPLLRWASVWGVDDEMAWDCAVRHLDFADSSDYVRNDHLLEAETPHTSTD